MLDIIAVVEGRRAVAGSLELPYDVAREGRSRGARGGARGGATRRRTSALLRRVASAIEPRALEP